MPLSLLSQGELNLVPRDLSAGKPFLAQEGRLYISYLIEGGSITIDKLPDHLNYQWIDPKTGVSNKSGFVDSNTFASPDENAWVLILKK